MSSTDPLERRLYARDASLVEGSAGLLVFPAERRGRQRVHAGRREHGLPVVPRGSGTGLAGGSTPLGDALVLVTTKMTADPRGPSRGSARVGRARRVQPGPREALAPTGFTFAPDPSSQQVCSIGGNVNTNAAARTASPTASPARTCWRSTSCSPTARVRGSGSEGPAAAGYDLRGFMVGSEGTLGVVVGGVRPSHADPARGSHDAAGLRDGRCLRRDGLGDHRAAEWSRRPSR